MEVNLNVNSARPVPSTSQQPKVPVQSASADAVEFSGAAALNRLIDEIPQVRPEAVARARELISQPSYPPTETIKRIAALFAFNMGQTSAEL